MAFHVFALMALEGEETDVFMLRNWLQPYDLFDMNVINRGQCIDCLCKEDIPLKPVSGPALGAASDTNHRHVIHRFWRFCLRARLPQHCTVMVSTYCWQELPRTSTSFLTREGSRNLEMISSMTPIRLFQLERRYPPICTLWANSQICFNIPLLLGNASKRCVTATPC